MPICKLNVRTLALYSKVPQHMVIALQRQRPIMVLRGIFLSIQQASLGITAAPAHFDERESLWDVIGHFNGLLLADKGLIGADFQQQIKMKPELTYKHLCVII